jgi:hypothetical protein
VSGELISRPPMCVVIPQSWSILPFVNPRIYQFRLPKLRGFPAVLMWILVALALVGVFMLALAVIAGLAIGAACAALGYGIRRLVTGKRGSKDSAVTSPPEGKVRDIEVEVLPPINRP